MTNGKSADAYLLCADRNEAEGLAARAKRYAQKNGYTIREIYFCKEDINSALLEKIIASLSARGIKMLILPDWDALGDDEVIRQERRSNIRRTGAKPVFLKGPHKQPYALKLLNDIKNYNSYALGWKLRIGFTEPPMQYKISNGSRLFGYDTVNNHYEINEEQAKLVRFIFDMYNLGMNASAISERLKDSGVKHRFPASSIRSMLRNEHYAGMDNGMQGVIPAIGTNRQLLTAKGITMEKKKSESPLYIFLFNNIIFSSNMNIVKLAPAHSAGRFNHPCYRGVCGETVVAADSVKLESLLTAKIYENLPEAMDAECAYVTAFAEAQTEKIIRYIRETEHEQAVLTLKFNKAFHPQNRIIRREVMKKFDELKLALDETNKKLRRAGILFELYSQDRENIYDFFEKAKRLPSMHRSEAHFFLNVLISRINIEENQITINCNYNGGEIKTIRGTSGFIMKSALKQRTESKPEFTR